MMTGWADIKRTSGSSKDFTHRAAADGSYGLKVATTPREEKPYLGRRCPKRAGARKEKKHLGGEGTAHWLFRTWSHPAQPCSPQEQTAVLWPCVTSACTPPLLHICPRDISCPSPHLPLSCLVPLFGLRDSPSASTLCGEPHRGLHQGSMGLWPLPRPSGLSSGPLSSGVKAVQFHSNFKWHIFNTPTWPSLSSAKARVFWWTPSPADATVAAAANWRRAIEVGLGLIKYAASKEHQMRGSMRRD